MSFPSGQCAEWSDLGGSSRLNTVVLSGTGAVHSGTFGNLRAGRVLGLLQRLGVCWLWVHHCPELLSQWRAVCIPHDSICPTGQLCRWETCFQSYELRSITQCFRVFKFCLLFRVQLVSKECNHCVNQGMTVLCFVRNFIKGLLCHWQWFCLSFWGHPCKIHSIYIGSWCVHGNFSWVQASDHSFMTGSVVICMLRYMSLYCMLPSFLDLGHAGETLHLWIDFPTTEMLLAKHIIMLIINK